MKKMFLMAALVLMGTTAFAQQQRTQAQAQTAQRQQVRTAAFLEVYDIETKQRTVIHEFSPSERMEAPNWSVDGKYLYYNASGRIYRIPSEGGTPTLINLDYVTGCNNDHVLSTDGKQIAVSASFKGGRGSYIFIAPIDGGIPRIVTGSTPSYLHGWSPDGKTIAFCGQRPGKQDMDVWVMDLETGQEKALTDGGGLDDGPEYSSDGKTIWFNSVRTGLMQVWKMNADGSGQTQMTFDEDRNSWFPHISPDGKKVVYLAYRKGDLEPGQHIGNLNVELRMIPAEGGKPETVVKLFGGQGSINVNSWSPDSKKFAFVSYKIVE